MRVGVVAVLLVLGVAFATPDAQTSQEVTELFRADGTFAQENLLSRTYYHHKHNCNVDVCLTGSGSFQAKCSRDIDNVIVICKEGTAWKYTDIKGSFFVCGLKNCTIKSVCVKCGNNYDNGCPAHWGCGSCVHNPGRCSNPKPTPKQTPKPAPQDCKDRDNHCAHLDCKWHSVREKCPQTCGKCPNSPKETPKPDPSCKDKDKDCPKLDCKWFSVRKKCPSKCGTCPKATPKPTPKPDPSCKDKDKDCPKLDCKWFSVRNKCPSKCGTCPKATPKPTPKPDPSCKDKDKDCPKLDCKWFSVRKKCPSKCGTCPKPTPTPTPTPKPDRNCKDKDKDCPKLDCKWFSVRKKCPSKCDRCPKSTPSPSPSPYMTPSPSPGPTGPCRGNPTEICFAADVFNARGSQGWTDVQFFARKTIKAVESLFDATPDLVSFMGVAFGTNIYGTTEFKTDGKEVADFFKGISYSDGGSQIELALKRCRQAFVTPGDVNRVVVLITDGNSKMEDGSPLPFRLIEKQADLLKEDGARVFAVAIEDDGNQAQLRKVSGKKGSDVIHYHRLDKYKTQKSFENYANKLVSCV